jgi:hypothetical protein
MTKTEQDLKIAEWLSWGLHNGVYPELLVVAATALRAAQEGKTSAPLDAWYEGLKQDEFEETTPEEYVSALVTERKGEEPAFLPTVARWLELNDGQELSVQASVHHYCAPRNDTGPWTHFEVATDRYNQFEELRPYAECQEDMDEGIYVHAEVPAKVICDIITRCGGPKEER